MNNQYPELYSSFRWLVPSQFNIAQYCLLRWASNTLEGRRPAVFAENDFGESTMHTYGQLAETTGKLANGLIKMGIGNGDRVAVAMGQSPEYITACMAILAVGGIVVPIPAILNAKQVTERLSHAQARAAIVDMPHAPGILQAYGQYPGLSQIISLGFQHELTLSWSSLLARQNSEFHVVPTSSSSAAFLLYPIGHASALKGVLLSHSALIGVLPGFVASQNWFPQPKDIFWTQHSWSSVDGLLGGLLPCLYFGRPIVALDGHFSTRQTIECLHKYKVSNISLPCSSLRAVMEEPQPDLGSLSVRAIMSTGEHPSGQVYEWYANTLGLTPNHVYGQTEAPYIVGHSHARWPARPGSMGKPFPGHLVTVLDEAGRPCPAGIIGQIAVNRYDIHGFPDPALFLSYWQDETSTQQPFLRDWYLTGEHASIDRDGYFWYTGHQSDIESQPAANSNGSVSLSL
jgi:acetyl-CoA synthetase|tara:strand:- start:112114 stop:113487 length:1374 start_codon:yes stop_codon:yes gene_type:complete